MQSLAAHLPNATPETGLLSIGSSDVNAGQSQALGFSKELAKSLEGARSEGSQGTEYKGFSPSEIPNSSELDPTQTTAQLASASPLEMQLRGLNTTPTVRSPSELVAENAAQPLPNNDVLADSQRASTLLSGEQVPASGKPLPPSMLSSMNGAVRFGALHLNGRHQPSEHTLTATKSEVMQLTDANANSLESDLLRGPGRLDLSEDPTLLREAKLIDRQFEKAFDNKLSKELTMSSEISSKWSNTQSASAADKSIQNLMHGAFGVGSIGNSNNSSSIFDSGLLTTSITNNQSPLAQAPTTSTAEFALKSVQPADSLIQAVNESSQKPTSSAESIYRDQISTPYGSSKWYGDFAGKIRIMSQANMPVAELNLNPAELGAIEIRIQALDEGTQVNFFSSNAATREIIDESLPRLRELLADSGINLQQGDVSDRKADQHSESPKFAQQSDIAANELTTEIHLGHRRSQQRSMIDHYV